MKNLLGKMKNKLPNRQQVFRILSVFLVVSFFISYIGFTISNQDTLLPLNPLDKSANKSHVPLMDIHKDLIHAEEVTDEDVEQEKDDEKKNKEQEENQDREQKIKDRNNQDDTNTDPENDEVKDQQKSDSGEDEQGSRDLEIINEVPDDEKQKDINDYFTTSIVEGETVTNKDYAFQIKQRNHDHDVEDIQVNINSQNENVIATTNNYNEPMRYNLVLTQKKNQIRISVTYKDKKDESFTVSRTYTVYFDKDELVIQSNLKDGQIVNQEDLAFQASAKLGETNAPVIVELNDKELEKNGTDNYNVLLKEGKNKVTVESNFQSQHAKKKYYITYKKPKLTIDTNLKDTTVDEPNFTFTAKAFDGNQKVDLSIVHDKNAIDENKNGEYRVKLSEGKNIFQLTATKGDVIQEETYKVIYNSNADTGEEEEENEDAPTIEIHDIQEGQTIRSSSLTFHVRAKSYKGESLTGGNGTISAKNNGTKINMNHQDQYQISFTLDVQQGENKIVVDAEDNEGNVATKSIIVYGDLAEEGESTGHITVSIEATTIGLGYLIEPKEVEIYQGDNAAHMIDRLLKEHGFSYDNTGSIESSFYLSRINKANIVVDPVIPEDLLEELKNDNAQIDLERYNSDSLGEFNFTSGSGWMYSVNENAPNVGFSDYTLKDGDTVRIRYTLALGKDIGGDDHYDKEW